MNSRSNNQSSRSNSQERSSPSQSNQTRLFTQSKDYQSRDHQNNEGKSYMSGGFNNLGIGNNQTLSPIQESKSSSAMTNKDVQSIKPNISGRSSQLYQPQINVLQDQNFSFDQKAPSNQTPEKAFINKATKSKSKHAQSKISLKSSTLSNTHRIKSDTDNLRFKIEQLFAYYCDYSLEKGEIFIKQANLIKLLKDSNILTNDNHEVLDQNTIILLMSKEMANPSQKALDFLSFLNLLVKLSYLIFNQGEGGIQDPKACLQKLLQKHILPLLAQLESQISSNQEINKSNISLLTSNGQYISNISLDILSEIQCSEEDFFILGSIKNVLKLMYEYYFACNNKKQETTLKKVFKFLKELDISPYLLNQKTSFMIFYFTAICKTEESLLNIVEKTEKMRLKQKSLNIKVEIQENPDLTFEQFLSMLYRIAIVYYDTNFGTNDAHSPKKLLSFFSRIELTKGFTDFTNYYRQFKSMHAQFQLTPSKPILLQIYLNQQKFESQQELEYTRDVVLGSMDAFQICKLITSDQSNGQASASSMNLSQDKTNQMTHVMEQSQIELQNYFDMVEDQLVKIFQSYCSFGNPTNTDKLKSSKLTKIFNDANLLSDSLTVHADQTLQHSFANKSSPYSLNPQKHSSTFTQIFSHLGRNASRDGLDQSLTSNKSQQIQRNQNQNLTQRTNKDQSHFGISRNELDVIFKNIASKAISTFTKHTFSQYGKSPNKQRVRDSSASSQSRGKDQLSSIHVDSNSINYNQFKVVLFEASRIIYRNFNPYESCMMMIKDKIMPLYGLGSDARSIQNIKLQEMLLKLEDDYVIELLTDLHQVIHKVYENYANHKGNMDFQMFMKFCTDFSIFPDILNKADVHRIFMNLAFQITQPSKFNESNGTLIKSSEIKQGLMSSTMSSGQSNSNNDQLMKQVHVIDQHLFIEGLALCALHIDSANYASLLPKEQEAIEKLLIFIEKIAASEGLRRGKEKKIDARIKSVSLEKVDIMGFFRKKYKWYYEKKSEAQVLNINMGMNGMAVDAIKEILLKEQIKEKKKETNKKGGNMMSMLGSTMNAKIQNDMMRKSFDPSMTSRNKNTLMSMSAGKTDLFSLVLGDEKKKL